MVVVASLLACGGAATGCASKLDEGLPASHGGDGGTDDGGGANGGGNGKDASVYRDAMVTSDAFFINDPPPPMCSPDGAVIEAEDPGGTEQCPDDKNREGCPCTTEGETVACWPGKRANRNLGVCKDGVTTCNATSEFGNRWGPCVGYKLPTPGAVLGPEACGCFSDGIWSFDNLVPCTDEVNGHIYLYSSHPDGKGGFVCNSNSAEPPTVPAEDWTPNTLKVGCAGHFTLCFTIKGGDVKNPQASDCVINRQCVDAVYPNENEVMPLANLKGWASTDPACGQRFKDVGGYGEMTVQGKSANCDDVGDGNGGEYVFQRNGYCKSGGCSTGGSGMFGN